MYIQIEETIDKNNLDAINEIVTITKRHTDLTVLNESLKYIKEVFTEIFQGIKFYKGRNHIAVLDINTDARILLITK